MRLIKHGANKNEYYLLLDREQKAFKLSLVGLYELKHLVTQMIDHETINYIRDTQDIKEAFEEAIGYDEGEKSIEAVTLEEALKKALEEEDYKEAARIRDDIKKRQ